MARQRRQHEHASKTDRPKTERAPGEGAVDRVEVGDRGAGMDAAPICAPEPTQAAGRGIHFMRTMADDVLFACGPTGTRVLLTKKLR